MRFSGAERQEHGLSSKEMSVDLPGRGDLTAFWGMELVSNGATLQSLRLPGRRGRGVCGPVNGGGEQDVWPLVPTLM